MQRQLCLKSYNRCFIAPLVQTPQCTVPTRSEYKSAASKQYAMSVCKSSRVVFLNRRIGAVQCSVHNRRTSCCYYINAVSY